MAKNEIQNAARKSVSTTFKSHIAIAWNAFTRNYLEK